MQDPDIFGTLYTSVFKHSRACVLQTLEDGAESIRRLKSAISVLEYAPAREMTTMEQKIRETPQSGIGVSQINTVSSGH